MGYFGPPVNSIYDYGDVDGESSPYDPDIKVPDQWKHPDLQYYPKISRSGRLASGLEGIEGISDIVPALKQFLSNHWVFLLAIGVGLYLMWKRER